MHIPFRLLSLGLLLMLAACGSTATTQYYILNTMKPIHPPAVADHHSVVLQVELPRYLDRTRIISRDHANQLHVAEHHQWGGHLRDNIARTLADDLSMRLGSANVDITPLPASMEAELTLVVNILVFERMADGHVHLHVQWHLLADEKKLQSRIEKLSSNRSLDARDYDTMVTEMNALLAQLADHIAEAIRRHGHTAD